MVFWQIGYVADSRRHFFQLLSSLSVSIYAFSALTLLVGRQEGHPAGKKTERWGAGVVICLERGAGLHTAERISLPLTVSCFSKIQIGFTFLVPAHLGSPGQRVVRRVCVCVCWAVYQFIFCEEFSTLLFPCYMLQMQGLFVVQLYAFSIADVAEFFPEELFRH